MKGMPLLVLSMIASRSDEEGLAWPNLDTLARDTRMSKRNVTRALKLIPADELEIIVKGGSPKGGERVRTLYRIRINTGDTTTPVSSCSEPATNGTMTPVRNSDRCPTVISTGDNFGTTGDKNGSRPVSYGHPNNHITDKRTVSEQSDSANAFLPFSDSSGSKTEQRTQQNCSSAPSEKKSKPKARKLAGDVSTLILPFFLDKPEFRKALEDWQVYKEAKRDPLTQRALELIVDDCEKWGLEKSIQYIRNAIKLGWKGIYEPNSPAWPINGNIRPKSEGSPKPSQEDLLSRQPEAVRKAIEEEGNL
jgi:hypothetical protein